MTETAALLAAHGTSIEEILRYAPPVADGETLLFVGSIPEGLSNRRSDVDLLYLGDNKLLLETQLKFQGAQDFSVAFNEAGTEINVDRITSSALTDLADKIATAIESLDNPRRTNPTVLREFGKLKLCHRISTGVPLINPEVASLWRQRMRLDRLAPYICSIYATDTYAFLEDVVAEAEVGNFESAVWMIRTAVIPALVASMLASVGDAQPARKWHYKLLKRYESTLGEVHVQNILGLVDGTIELSGPELVNRLLEIVNPILDALLRRDKAVYRMTHWFNQAVRHASSPAMPLGQR